MNVRLIPSLAVFAFAAALAVPASADVAPPNTAGCASAAEGDACVTDAKTEGACVKNTCTGLDYSNGTPPTTKSYDCLQCTEGAAGTTSGGCSFAAGHAGTAGALLSLLGISMLLGRRRRAR